MAHECPRCGQACYCCGDIDDVDHGECPLECTHHCQDDVEFGSAEDFEALTALCHCQSPWPSPCDGLLAGGVCDQLGCGHPVIEDDDTTPDDDPQESP